jgi:hypothetical protein
VRGRIEGEIVPATIAAERVRGDLVIRSGTLRQERGDGAKREQGRYQRDSIRTA